MRWRTLFRLDPLTHAETHAAPPPLDRVELATTHGGRAAMEDVPHAVADLLTHAMPFVAGGVPGVVPLDVEHAQDGGAWRYVLQLPEGSARARGRPETGAGHGEEVDVQAHAVTVEGSREFAHAVAEAVTALRAVPGVVEHLLGQRADLDAALARAQAAEETLQEIYDRDDG